MDKRSGTIDESVREYAAAKRRSRSSHPEIEELSAYHEGELAGEAQERIRDHLSLCAECTRLVLDLGRFGELEPPSEQHRLSATEIKRQKQAVMERIQGEEAPPAKVLDFVPRHGDEVPRPARRSMAATPVWYHVVAAAFAAATLGLGFWVAALRQPPAAAPAADVNVEIRNLFPLASGVRGTSPPEPLRLGPNRDLALILELLDPETYPDYRVEIVGADGKKLWESDGLERKAAGNFALSFPRSIRAPGSYQVLLFGLRDGSPTLMAEYLLDLR